MNKTEFNYTFKLLCANPDRALSQEQLVDKRELFWLKFNKLEKNIFFDACMSWIDKSKFMPTVYQIKEIIDNREAKQQPEQPKKNPRYMYNSDGTRMTMRDHFVKANKDIAGKKRHHIEHLGLVKLYDNMQKNKKRKRPEVIKGSNIKKLSDCM